MMINRLQLLLAVSVLLAGCDSTSNADLEKQLNAANAQITSLQSDVEVLKKSSKEQNQKQNMDDLVQSFEKLAYLTPGSEGYSTVRFDLGVLTVKISDVTSYANGSKVVLKFGNTLSAAVNGLKVTLDWGKVSDKGYAENETAKSKEITFTETLRAGAWTSIPVVLEGIPPSELGFVRVHDIEHRGIELLR